MSDEFSTESMLDMYIFETSQNIEQLEMCVLQTEKSSYSQDAINEIFRIMHTIKGSSAMMLFNNISSLAHSIEDLFFFLREQKPQNIDYTILSDLILEGVDFIKIELQKIKDGNKADGNNSNLIERIEGYLLQIKTQNNSKSEIDLSVSNIQPQYYITPNNVNYSNKNRNFYKAIIFFEDGCEMENIRAYTIIHNLRDIADEVYYIPDDIIENDGSVSVIREKGFKIYVKADKSFTEMNEFYNHTVFLRDLELTQLETDEEFRQFYMPQNILVEESPVKTPEIKQTESSQQTDTHSVAQSIISVNVKKLDKLMDLVGEMVISEAMVTQNPDIKDLEIENFQKAARQLHKITSELQDMVMSIRMVPLSTTFQKMHRIVRDMSRKLDKEVHLELLGEETEVDKNIIEHISDPLMHLVRNSLDHGIEAADERVAKGKSGFGKITLEAKNSGSDVLVIVKDDGKGLNKEKILKRARENELLVKSEQEMSEREIYNLIFLPGFSTKEDVSEFSGRGVGMDVVSKNIEAVGGSVNVDSNEGVGTTVTLKIPLTLAIIDGMNVRVGKSCYTIPTTAIKESFRPKREEIIEDPDGNEIIMVRGQCYPILRLHKFYGVKTEIVDFVKGILIMVEQDKKTFCIFADELLGQQQVVVKTLPGYIKKLRRIEGLSGCTLLGDGSISLILNISGLMNKESIV